MIKGTDMKLKLFKYSILLILGLSLISCSSKVKKEYIVIQDSAYKIVIASDQSDYKDAIRGMLVEKYKSNSIDIVNIEDLEGIDEKHYDVVVILDTCMAWSGFNPSLKNFIDRNKEKNTVLFITAGDPDWKYNYKGVDAITSASEIELKDGIFNKIAEQIDKIIEKD